jgi:polyribonucleotide nucleotidyltransferase
MNDAIAAPRDDVKPTAPKIISFEIPIDKIGEVIGPKGKVINTITQETGADVSVSDDGAVGTVTVGSKESSSVEEARRRIELILDPPTADLGAEYTGKVVNITKFGAFVNVLPGKDGLLHISKLGRGKRIDRVEDVLSLGEEVTVRVDDIDNAGKLSLSLAGDDDQDSSDDGDRAPRADAPSRRPERDREPRERRDRAPREDREARSDRGSDGGGEGGGDREVASFEDRWEAQAKDEFGDLGPGEAARAGAPGGGGGPRRRRRR